MEADRRYRAARIAPTCVYRPTVVATVPAVALPFPGGRPWGAAYFYSCPGEDGVTWLPSPAGLVPSPVASGPARHPARRP